MSEMADNSIKGDYNMQNATLENYDPDLFELITKEKLRQQRSLELVASENFVSYSILQCLGSCLHYKYSEGVPGNRYYGGNKFIDQMEELCQSRCLKAFRLDPNVWGVNVQALSGSPANLIVYMALLKPREKIMGLSFADGGHFSHGYDCDNCLSAASMFYTTKSYKIDPKSGEIDYEELQRSACEFQPNLIIAGISSYNRHLDYKRFREIANETSSLLHVDMSHIAGIVAADLCVSPFEYADTVMTTTHKTFRGPRAAIIFYRKNGKIANLSERINAAVFPGLQGGPHNHTIAAISLAALQAQSPEFKQYQQNVLQNCKFLAEKLSSKGYKLLSDGSDLHMIVIDLRSKGISGLKAMKLLEMVSIDCNKNIIPGETVKYSGIRVGTPALTTRGLSRNDFNEVFNFFDEAISLAREIDISFNNSADNLEEFAIFAEKSPKLSNKIKSLKSRVEDFSSQFKIPGFRDL